MSDKPDAEIAQLRTTARELCDALAALLRGPKPVRSFCGYENGHGQEVGTRLEKARRAMGRLIATEGGK